MFVSSATQYLPKKPIRGGVPVCFPQMGFYGPGGKHGFARTSEKWTVEETSTNADDELQSATLCLVGDGTESKEWPHPFELRVIVNLGAQSLNMSMNVTNTGSNDMTFTCLLHTYLTVGDIKKTSVKGFKGCSYITENEATPGTFTDDRELATIECETDRIYTDCNQVLELKEEGGRQGGTMTIQKDGFKDFVLWNIWEESAKAMSDLGQGEW